MLRVFLQGMKVRTRNKILHYLGVVVRFILKCIFIYPFKALWFLLKQIYLVISDLVSKRRAGKEGRVEESTHSAASGKSTSKKINGTNDDEKPRIVRRGVKRHEPRHAGFREVRSHEGKLGEFEGKIIGSKSSIGLILGARGSGKSALGMSILESAKAQTSRPIYAVGFKAEALPDWITTVTHLDDIPNNSFVLIDEGGIEFSSRNSQSDSNKLLSQLLFIARHKDMTILFITQNSSTLEINAIRQLDFLLLKKPSLLQKDFERGRIREMYDKVDTEFKELAVREEGLVYVYADCYKGFASNQLPTFWGEDVSKSYRGK